MPFCPEPARVKPRAHSQISIIPSERILIGALRSAPEDDISALAVSIKRLGLLAPLLVRPQGDAYELIAGTRRLRACRALGMAEIECIVMQALNEECMLAALADNLSHREPPCSEVIRLRRRLETGHGYTPDALDTLTGVRGRRASMAPPVLPAEPYAPQAVGAGHIAPADALPIQPRRSARGYIRDERLIINAVARVVDGLRESGIAAALDIRAHGGFMALEVSFPRPPRAVPMAEDGPDPLERPERTPESCREDTAAYSKNISDTGAAAPVKSQNYKSAHADTGLDLSDIGHVLRNLQAENTFSPASPADLGDKCGMASDPPPLYGHAEPSDSRRIADRAGCDAASSAKLGDKCGMTSDPPPLYGHAEPSDSRSSVADRAGSDATSPAGFGDKGGTASDPSPLYGHADLSDSYGISDRAGSDATSPADLGDKGGMASDPSPLYGHAEPSDGYGIADRAGCETPAAPDSEEATRGNACGRICDSSTASARESRPSFTEPASGPALNGADLPLYAGAGQYNPHNTRLAPASGAQAGATISAAYSANDMPRATAGAGAPPPDARKYLSELFREELRHVRHKFIVS